MADHASMIFFRSGRFDLEAAATALADRGLSVSAVDALAEVAGDYVDVVKLGWGTSLVTGNLEAKLARYRKHDLPVVLGARLPRPAGDARRRSVVPVRPVGRRVGD